MKLNCRFKCAANWIKLCVTMRLIIFIVQKKDYLLFIYISDSLMTISNIYPAPYLPNPTPYLPAPTPPTLTSNWPDSGDNKKILWLFIDLQWFVFWFWMVVASFLTNPSPFIKIYYSKQEASQIQKGSG